MNRRVLMLALLAAVPAWAHNGVDHGAHHGGVMGTTKDLHVEAVTPLAGGVQLYFFDKMGEPLPASAVTDVAAEIEHPGGKTDSVDMAIDPTGVFWTGKAAPLTDAKAVLHVGFSFHGAAAMVDVPGASLIAAAKKGPPKKATTVADHKVADGHN